MTLPLKTFVEQLRALGVRKGGVCMAHAGLRTLGPVEGRAVGIIEGLRRVLGPEGTMLMMIAADDAEPFDPETTPVDVEEMSVLAEVFRTSEGTRVSRHPACRFAARGPAAEALLAPDPWDDYYGPGSVLEAFVEHEGQVLRLGPAIDTVTLTHHAEYLAKVPSKKTVRRRYVLADGGEVFVDSLDDSRGIRQWEHGDYFPQILIDFIDAGHAALGPVGACRAELLEARPFVDFAVAWLEREFAEPA